MANAKTTTEHLKKYIGEILDDSNVDAKFAAYCLEKTFGEDIHKKIDGFISYVLEFPNRFNNEVDMAIATTLCHDVSGGINHDKLMMPRVSDYAEYSKA